MSRAWMPLYVGDYLADTTHLTTIEHGAYLLLIMHYWQKGSLPNDDKQLAQITRLDARRWGGLKQKIQPLFAQGWVHPRIDEELKKSLEISEKRKAARAMVGRKSPTSVTTLAGQKTTQSQSQSQSQSQVTEIEDPKQQTVDEEKTSSSPSRYAFEAGVIKLNERDFKAWKRAYQNVDLEAELIALSGWAGEQKSWFNAVAGALAKKNRERGNQLAGIRERARAEAELATKPRRSLV